MLIPEAFPADLEHLAKSLQRPFEVTPGLEQKRIMRQGRGVLGMVLAVALVFDLDEPESQFRGTGDVARLVLPNQFLIKQSRIHGHFAASFH